MDELLNLVQLDGLGDRYPSQPGGAAAADGTRSRLPRSLRLFLDEPFGALDARVRAELREWLTRLHDVVHVTTVFVTHDQEEAMEVADQITLLNEGRVVQVGAAAAYDEPESEFVMRFIGDEQIGGVVRPRTWSCCRSRPLARRRP